MAGTGLREIYEFEDDEPSRTLARPGDVVTCPKGHANYRVVEPIIAGEEPQRTWVARVDDGSHPPLGDAPPCIVCGGEVFPQFANSNRYALFIDGKLTGEERR